MTRGSHMKRRWAITATVAAVICMSSAVVGVAEATTLTNTIQPRYNGYANCPSDNLCLYQDGQGRGTEATVYAGPPKYDDPPKLVNLTDAPFRDPWFYGPNHFTPYANDQVSSIFNNSWRCVSL